MTDLTKEQTQRYARQIVLPGFGEEGQKKLLETGVLIIGAGGLGSPCALYLAAAGIGTIGIVDADKVGLENMQRQILHSMDNIGKSKVESAGQRISSVNTDIKVVTYNGRFNSQNALDIIKDYTMVIDCSDNFPTRYLINDACVLSNKPFCHAGVLRFEGQAMTILPGESACFRCLFPEPPDIKAMPSPAEAGILGAVAGLIGTVQATEVLKYILDTGDLLTGRLLVYDARRMNFRHVTVPRDPECRVCGENPGITTLLDY